jgi:organic radical activating enzyme
VYLQITTKCNFTCAHCCYSCNRNGKHGDYHQIIDNIAFARSYDDNSPSLFFRSITIGGGEPTLHPRFFDILRYCLNDFEYVWMATNGSQTKTMFRLADIINQEDYPECTCKTDEERDNCYCHENDTNSIYQEDKLTVALSQDPWHDMIDDRIVRLWTREANRHNRSGFEIRNVSASRNGAIAAGRAKRTGAGWAEGCVCSDIIIKPDGKLRLCGCANAPVIGTTWDGIEEKWEKFMQNEEFYHDTNCYNGR